MSIFHLANGKNQDVHGILDIKVYLLDGPVQALVASTSRALNSNAYKSEEVMMRPADHFEGHN